MGIFRASSFQIQFTFLALAVLATTFLSRLTLAGSVRVVLGFWLSFYLPGHLLLRIFRGAGLASWERLPAEILLSLPVIVGFVLLLGRIGIPMTPLNITLTIMIANLLFATGVILTRRHSVTREHP